jgi:hypothetical protein
MSVLLRASLVRALLVSVSLAAGCVGPAEQRGSSVVIPTNVAEGHGEGHSGHGKKAAAESTAPATTAPGSPSPSATSGAAAPASAEHGAPPDPVPLTTQHQWDLTLHYSKGTVRLVEAKAVELAAPVTTPRRMGRFAVELWVGKELVDRVRFDFPLLGADGPPGADRRPVQGAPRFSPGADTRSTVRVPASDRATSAGIVDRQSGATVSIPWPPNEAAPAAGP